MSDGGPDENSVDKIREEILANIRKDWQVPILNEFDFKEVEILSSGWRTTIRAGRLKAGQSKELVVVKEFTRRTAKKIANQEAKWKRLYQYYIRECGIWRKLGSHPNIVQILGVLESYRGSIFPAVVMPRYQHRDLRTFIEKTPGTTLNTRVKLMHDVGQGLLYLHTLSPPLVHRDIMGSNVLVNEEDGVLVSNISDFGSAKFSFAEEYDFTSSRREAALDWMAPEIFDKNCSLGTVSGGSTTPTCKSDMWSFACTFLEVLTARNPYGTTGCSPDALLRGCAPDRPQDVQIDDALWKFMKLCWKKRPQDRLSSEDAVIYLKSLKLNTL